MQSSSSYVMPAAFGMSSSLWILDSGATHHMIVNATTLIHLYSTHPFSSVHTVNGSFLLATESGHLWPPSFTVPTVHHVLGLALNIISISQLTDHGLTITFFSSDYSVQDHLTRQRIRTIRRVGCLYHLEFLHLLVSPSSSTCTPIIVASVYSLDRWHSHLGHVSNACLNY